MIFAGEREGIGPSIIRATLRHRLRFQFLPAADGGLQYTAEGWARDVTEEVAARLLDLNAGSISSQYAFFARKFENPDLDTVFKDCPCSRRCADRL